jgi:hypothetical protein
MSAEWTKTGQRRYEKVWMGGSKSGLLKNSKAEKNWATLFIICLYPCCPSTVFPGVGISSLPTNWEKIAYQEDAKELHLN